MKLTHIPGNVACALLVLLACRSIRADDWPQWFGPKRDGVWREAGLLQAFPPGGPTILWRASIGAGYSGPAVAGGRVYVMDRVPAPEAKRPANPFQRITQPGVERVLCLDEATGKVLWTHAYERDYSMSYSAGPRATPAVDGDRVYAFGGEGDLSCLDARTGQVIWTKLVSGPQSPTPTWGFASHPLVDGDRVIVLTGGQDPQHGHGVVTAFDKRTGEVAWSALSAKEPGYAPAMTYDAKDGRQILAWDNEGVFGLEAATGKTMWSQPFGPARQGLSVLTPRVTHDAKLGDVLLVSTQYEGMLAMTLDPTTGKPTVLWKRAGRSDRNTDALHSLIATPAVRDGCVYGIDTYGQLRCLDLATGDRRWETAAATTYDAGPQKWATAFLIPLGDAGTRFLIANEHGDLILADLDPAGYHEVSRAHVLEPTNHDPQRPVVWSHPALAGGRLYWRNDKEMVCVSMRPG